MDPQQQASSIGPSSSRPVPDKPLTLDDFKGLGVERKLRGSSGFSFRLPPCFFLARWFLSRLFLPYTLPAILTDPADGQPPKRRGPKPDSKPAQTRRQELNRQAQRTHRERKEQYLKLLEEEVQDSRTRFEQISQDLRDSRNEVKRLRQLLSSHGIPFLGPNHDNNPPPPQSPDSAPPHSASHHSFNPASTPQFSAGAPSTASPPADAPHHNFQLSPDISQRHESLSPHHQHFSQQPERATRIVPELLMANEIDYTQFAKDFIKSYV